MEFGSDTSDSEPQSVDYTSDDNDPGTSTQDCLFVNLHQSCLLLVKDF